MGETRAVTASNPQSWLAEHGDVLYAFAFARVGRSDVAEDLVQETLLAALQSAQGYAGRSSERTWLVGILKNKLIDRLRREQRSPITTDFQTEDGFLDSLYDKTGHWQTPPGRWGADPTIALEQREFWEAFHACRELLPERLRLVLSLRLLDEVPTADICAALEISANNLWTLLHRARVRLWNCLDRKGLGQPASEGAR